MRELWVAIRKPLLLGIVAVSVSMLAACATTTARVARATSTATSAATATLSGPQPTPILATPGDTSVCAVISPAEFATIAATTATQITSGATDDSLTGLTEVYCIYNDASDPHVFLGRGTLNYEFASDASTAAALFAHVKQTFTGVIDVAGVGDSAFEGTPGGAPDGSGSGLLVLRGRLLLYLSVSGDQQMVTRITKALAALALSRVA